MGFRRKRALRFGTMVIGVVVILWMGLAPEDDETQRSRARGEDRVRADGRFAPRPDGFDMDRRRFGARATKRLRRRRLVDGGWVELGNSDAGAAAEAERPPVVVVPTPPAVDVLVAEIADDGGVVIRHRTFHRAEDGGMVVHYHGRRTGGPDAGLR